MLILNSISCMMYSSAARYSAVQVTKGKRTPPFPNYAPDATMLPFQLHNPTRFPHFNHHITICQQKQYTSKTHHLQIIHKLYLELHYEDDQTTQQTAEYSSSDQYIIVRMEANHWLTRIRSTWTTVLGGWKEELKQKKGEQEMKLEGHRCNQGQLSIDVKEEVGPIVQVSQHMPLQTESPQSSRNDGQLIQDIMSMLPKQQGQNPESEQSSSFGCPPSQVLGQSMNSLSVSSIPREEISSNGGNQVGSKSESNQKLEQAISQELEEKPTASRLAAGKKQEQPRKEEDEANMGQLWINSSGESASIVSMDEKSKKEEFMVSEFKVVCSDGSCEQVEKHQEEILEKQAETNKNGLTVQGTGQGGNKPMLQEEEEEALEHQQCEAKKEAAVIFSAGSSVSDQVEDECEDEEEEEGEEKEKEKQEKGDNQNPT